MAQQVKTSLDFVNEGKIINLPDGVDLQDAATVNQLSGIDGFTDGLLTGGIVTWSGSGLTFDVTAAYYKINGLFYNSAAGSITLDASDTVNDRLDVIGVDNTGAIVKITGTPAANPEIPQIDVSSQLYLTAIFVQANATTPVNINQSIIYNENTEWTGSAVNLTANFNNTVNPFTGTKAVDITAASNGGYLLFVNSTVLNSTSFDVLKFYIRLKATLANNANLNIKFFNGATQVSNAVTLGTAYGFVKNIINTYQNISINLSAFTFTNSSFDRIRITFTGGTFSAFYLDYMQLQAGVTGIPDIVWGDIKGILSNQTDLQTALDNKVDENGAIAGATKTKITYDAKGLVTAGADATTADIADSTDKRYVTDAEKTIIDNTSGVNTGDQTLPVKATASELNTGTDDAKFATALSLANSKYSDQSGSKISATASGTDTYTATITPAITAYIANQTFYILFTNANTGSSTINLNGLGAITLKKNVSTNLAAGDILAGQIFCITYDGTNFQMIGGSGGGGGTAATSAEINTGTDNTKMATPANLEGSKYITQSGARVYASTSGTNTYTATIAPAISAYAAGQGFKIKFTNANTGAATLNLNSLGAIALKKNVSSDLVAGDILAGQIVEVAYDGTNFQVIGDGTVILSQVNQKILSIAGNYSQSII